MIAITAVSHAQLLCDLADSNAITVKSAARIEALLGTVGLTLADVTAKVITDAEKLARREMADLQTRIDRLNKLRCATSEFDIPAGAKSKATADKSEAKPKAEKRVMDKVVRANIFGFSATSVIRWMGVNNWNAEDAGVALASFGAGDISDVTIRLQLKAGKDGKRGPAANLSAAQAKQLRKATK